MKRKHLNRELLDAIVLGNITKVQDLLEAGADISARDNEHQVGSSRVDLQACKLEYSIVSPK